jgi:hypothetical protein
MGMILLRMMDFARNILDGINLLGGDYDSEDSPSKVLHTGRVEGKLWDYCQWQTSLCV